MKHFTPTNRETNSLFHLQMVQRRNVGKRPCIPRICSKTGTTCKEWRSQLRTWRWTGMSSTDRIKRWRWSSCRLLVDSRWLHLPSPQGSTLCAEGRNISIPPKYIDVTRVTHTDPDVLQEKRIDNNWCIDSNRSLSDSWTRFWKFTLLRKPRDQCGPRCDWQNSSNCEAWECVSWNMDQDWKKPLRKEKSEPRQRSKVERHLLYNPGWWSTEWKLEIMLKTLEVSMEMRLTLAKEGRCQKHTHRARLRKLKGEGLHHRPDSQKEVCMCREGHESTRQRLEIFSAQKSWRPHFKAKDILEWPTTISFISLFRWRKLQWTRIGRRLRQFCLAVGKGQKHAGGYSWSTKRRKDSPLCFIDGYLSSQECGVRTTISAVLRVESCSEETLWGWFFCAVFTEHGSPVSQVTCAPSNGCYCKPTRLWRTSSRRDICWHSDKNGYRSKIAQKSEVRMSRYMDTIME